MDKSTESLSDSDSNTSTSWVFVEEGAPTTTDGGSTNQFYLNCTREPIQELTEHDLGTVASDIDSDTDGISVISESEENQLKETILEEEEEEEESSDDGMSVVSTKSSDEIEVLNDEETVEAVSKDIALSHQNVNDKLNGINWTRLLSTSSILGSSLVIFAILFAPYMSSEKQLDDSDNTVLNDNLHNYFYENKQKNLIYQENKIDHTNVKREIDYNIKYVKKLNKNKNLLQNKQTRNDLINDQSIKKQKRRTQIKPIIAGVNNNEAKIKKYQQHKRQKHKDKISLPRNKFDAKKENPNKQKKPFKKRKMIKYQNLDEAIDLFHEKIKDDINKFLQKEKNLKVREEYLLKKEKYLAIKESKLRRAVLKLAKTNDPEEVCKKLKATMESYPLHDSFEKDTHTHDMNHNERKKFKNFTVLNLQGRFNDSLNGDWYYNLHKGRNEMRNKEHSSDWVFDRALMRSRKRDKAHWYFQWMTDRALLRFKRSTRSYWS